MQAFKVTNNTAERELALATSFNSSITKQEEQKQFLLQVVENYRKRFPNCNRNTLAATALAEKNEALQAYLYLDVIFTQQ